MNNCSEWHIWALVPESMYHFDSSGLLLCFIFNISYEVIDLCWLYDELPSCEVWVLVFAVKSFYCWDWKPLWIFEIKRSTIMALNYILYIFLLEVLASKISFSDLTGYCSLKIVAFLLIRSASLSAKYFIIPVIVSLDILKWVYEFSH